MHLKILAISLLLSVLSWSSAVAQSLDKEPDDKMGLLYENDLSFGVRVNTNGWSLFGTYSQSVSAKRYRYYQIEFQEFLHPKEKKQTNEYLLRGVPTSPRPYVFGKQHNFYGLSFSIGNRIILGEKAARSGVEVTYIYQYGPTLGLAKPYYLEKINFNNDALPPTVSIKYTPETRDDFLNDNVIYGSSGFTKGLGELRFFPGVHGKTGLNFDWANYNEFVTALEVGLGVNLFLKRIPLMVDVPNRAYFIYLYMGIQFGKKW